MVSNAASLNYEPSVNFDWTKSTNSIKKEKTVVIPPYKVMSEEEVQAVRAEKAADRAFKIQELKEQAKKAGIPDDYIEMLESSPYNCKINTLTKTLTYNDVDESKQFTFKNGKLHRCVSIVENGLFSHQREKFVVDYKYSPAAFNVPYTDSDGNKHNESANAKAYQIGTSYVDGQRNGHFVKVSQSVCANFDGDMRIVKHTNYNSDGSIKK